MAEMDAGIMPVREGDRLGMITARHAVGRGPGQGIWHSCPEVMADEVLLLLRG